MKGNNAPYYDLLPYIPLDGEFVAKDIPGGVNGSVLKKLYNLGFIDRVQTVYRYQYDHAHKGKGGSRITVWMATDKLRATMECRGRGREREVSEIPKNCNANGTMKFNDYVNIQGWRIAQLNRIVEIVKEHQPTSAGDAARIIGISESEAKHKLQYLKEVGRVRLVHRWEVVE